MITNSVAILFILAMVVIISLYLERRYNSLRKIGAGGLAILIGILLSNTGIIPGISATYDFLMTEGVSAAIILILLSVDIKSVRDAGPTMLKAFALGAVGSALGSIVMALILHNSLGPETWKLSGQFTGTYIGGGMNFAALGRAFETSPNLFTAGIAADVILTSVWLLVCLAAPAILDRGKKQISTMVSNDNDSYTLEKSLYASKGAVNISHIAILLAIVFGSLYLSSLLAGAFSFLPEILWLTTIVLLIAQIPYIKNISGGAMLGNYLLLLFLASNGASSLVSNIVEVGPDVFYFATGTIAIHGLFIFGIGWMLKIDGGTLAVASQANVGGSSSALALASARGFPNLILPGIAVGLLGYAIGNYAGLLVANFLQAII